MADYQKLLEEFTQNPTAFAQDKEKVSQFVEGLKLVSSGKSPTGYGTSADFAKLYDEVMKLAFSTPGGQQAVKDMIRTKQTDRFVARNKPFLDAILSGADLVTSLSQIRQSNKAIKNLQRPTMPSPNVLDPQLNNAIAQAQRGSFEALRALEPAKQEIAQQRLMDMNTARSLSGGQAGAYGANATAASLRATRAAQRLPQIGDTIKARQQERADQLLGRRQNVLQNEFYNRMQIANQNFNQYNNDIASAAALGVAGRTNLRNTLGQLPEMLTRTAGNLMPVQDVWTDYGKRIESDLASRMSQSKLAGYPSVTPTIQGTFNGVNPIIPGQTTGAMLQNRIRQRRLNDLNAYTSNYSLPDLNQPRPLNLY